MSGFGFVNQSGLGWLYLGGALGSLLILWLIRFQAGKLKMLGPDYRPSSIKLVIALIFVLLGLFAAARPHLGYQEIEIAAPGQDLLVLVDVSRSMLAADIRPSRLDFVKRKLEDLVRLVKERSSGDRIALIPFAGEAYQFCPLTADYSVLLTFVRALDTNLISTPGSSLNRALSVALEVLERNQIENPQIILIGDGEDLSFNPEGTRKLLAGWLGRVDTIGVGSSEGHPIELADGSFVRNRAGKIVITKLESANLIEIAAIGNGVFQLASLDDSDLLRVLSSSPPGVKESTGSSRVIRNYREIGPVILLVVLLTTVVLSWLRPHLLLFMALLTLFQPNLALVAQDAIKPSSQKARDGFLAYQKGDFQSARDIFAQLYNQNISDLRLKEALAHSHFKLGQFDEAIPLYRELAASAKNARQAYQALYNLGNSLLQAQQFDHAIEAYQQALLNKPNDKKATHNLEIAEKLKQLQQQEQQQEPQERQEHADQEQEQDSQAEREDDDPSDQEDAEKGEETERDQELSREPNTQDSDNSNKESSDLEEQSQVPATQSNQTEAAEQSEKPQDSPGQESSSEAQDQVAKQPLNDYDPTSLPEREARAWLESLPDAPVILQRRAAAVDQEESGQTW